jgi:hypothetical protein
MREAIPLLDLAEAYGDWRSKPVNFKVGHYTYHLKALARKLTGMEKRARASCYEVPLH